MTCDMAWHGAAQHSMARSRTEWQGMAWHGTDMERAAEVASTAGMMEADQQADPLMEEIYMCWGPLNDLDATHLHS